MERPKQDGVAENDQPKQKHREILRGVQEIADFLGLNKKTVTKLKNTYADFPVWSASEKGTAFSTVKAMEQWIYKRILTDEEIEDPIQFRPIWKRSLRITPVDDAASEERIRRRAYLQEMGRLQARREFEVRTRRQKAAARAIYRKLSRGKEDKN